MRMRRLRAALVGLSALVVAGTAGAGARATWLPPVTLSAGAVFAPDVAVNEAGDALVAWQAADRRIVARFRAAAAGSWGPPVALGFGSADGTRPGVGIDAHGGGVVAWRGSDTPVHSAVFASGRSAATGRWEPARRLSREGVIGEPVVRVAEDENTVVLWLRFDAARDYLLETAYRPAFGGWSDPVEVTRSGWIFGIDLAVGDRGLALLSWVDERAGNVLRAAVGRGGSWQVPVELAAGVAYSDTSAAVGPAGRLAVGFSRQEHGNSLTKAAVRPGAESAWRIGNLSFEDGQAGAPELAFDGSGNLTAVWGTSVDFEASYLPSGAETWLRPVAISPPKGSAGALTLGVNRRGDAVAVWNSSGVGGDIVAATRPVGSLVWQAPTPVASGGWRVRNGLGLDGAGHVVVVWTHVRDGHGDVARLVALDAAPPVLFLELAPSGHVGEPLSFRASAFDVWSGLSGPLRWSFGDGSSATGRTVRHVYRTPGKYTATVQATDAVGQRAEATAGVRVEPATALRNRMRPSIAGRPRVGQRLVCLPGRWTGSRPRSFASRWLRDGRAIPGAAGRSYRVRERDAGTLIACRVRATNPAGTLIATSRAVRIAA